jgi:hypothetical protein
MRLAQNVNEILVASRMTGYYAETRTQL